MVAEFALPSRVVIWHNSTKCDGECGRLRQNSNDPEKSMIRCLRHGSCDCLRAKTHWRKPYPWYAERFTFTRPWCRLKTGSEDDKVICPKLARPSIPGLWLTCRQIHSETADLLYKTPIFAFDSKQTLGLWLNQRSYNRIPSRSGQGDVIQFERQNDFVRKIEVPSTCNIYKVFRTAPQLQHLYVHVETAFRYKTLTELPSTITTTSGRNVKMMYVDHLDHDERMGTQEQQFLKKLEKEGLCPEPKTPRRRRLLV